MLRLARVVRFAPLALVIGGALPYLNSFTGVMLFDDQPQIVCNPAITSILPLSRHFKDSRPLVSISFAVNYAVGELNPWGYHAVNLGVHLLAGLVLFGLVRRILSRTRVDADMIAFATALLWMVHPLNTQAVTYIIQRSESMMGLFYLLTLYAVVRTSDATRPRRWYVAAVIACALGMLCKAVMVTAPVLALLMDRIFLAGSWGRLRRRWPLHAGLAATWCLLIVTGVVQGLTGIGGTASHSVGFGVTTITPLQYALTQSRVLLHYLGLAFWPGDLCLDYGWQPVHGVTQVVVPLATIAGLFAASLFLLRRAPMICFWAAWFFVTLAPSSSVIPVKDVIFEHRMYLPLISLIVLTCMAASRVAAAWPKIGPTLAPTALLMIAFALGARTVVRNQDYHDEIGMWKSIAIRNPTYARARLGLGYALMVQGRLDEARAELETCLNLQPSWADTHTNLGLLDAQLGQFEAALARHTQAIQLNPDLVQAHVNLATAYIALDQPLDAVDPLREALRLAPNNFEAHDRLADARQRLEQFDKALVECETALRLRPHSIDTIVRRANLLADLGRHEEAIPIYRGVLANRPDSPETWSNLGTALRATADLSGAGSAYQTAIRLRPNYASALLNYGNLLRQQGNLLEAAGKYEEAVRAAPDNSTAHLAFGSLLYDLKRFGEGLSECEKAARLSPNSYLSHYYIGVGRERLGRVQDAAIAYGQCLRINPDFEPAKEKMRRTLPTASSPTTLDN